MPYLLVRHQVEEYERWRRLYDEHGATRKAAGCKGTQVFRDAESPNEIAILLEWDDLAKARQFTESEDLKETMQRAGVSGRPEIRFLDGAGRTSH